MPEVAWKDFYRMAEKAGYRVELLNQDDRRDFRKGIRDKYGLNPRENPIRVVCITGKDGKHGSEFFRDPAYLDSVKSEVMEMASQAAHGRERIGFNNHHYHRTPLEIVTDRLSAGQDTIEFIDPFRYDKLLVLFWRKVK